MWNERNRPKFYKDQISGPAPEPAAQEVEPPFPEPDVEGFDVDPDDGIEPETPT